MRRLRRVLRRLLRPFAGPILRRLDARYPARADVEILQSYLPVLLDAISAQNAAAREVRRLETLLEERIATLESKTEAGSSSTARSRDSAGGG